MSQRALQAHADPLLGWTDLDGVGFVVSEVSPYEADLDWSELTEPAEIAPVVDYLGRATAKVHCVADSDADHSLVPFQTEEAIAQVVAGREDEFVAWVVDVRPRLRGAGAGRPRAVRRRVPQRPYPGRCGVGRVVSGQRRA